MSENAMVTSSDRYFTVVAGPHTEATLPIPLGRSAIGRQPDAGVFVASNDVSRVHAVVDAAGNDTVIVDAGSSNGTRVNGQRIDGPWTLHDGDLVKLGTVVLRYAESSRPVPADPQWSAGIGGARDDWRGTSNVHRSTSRTTKNSSANDMYVAGRDQRFDQRHQHFGDQIGHLGDNRLEIDANPWDELFSGRGAGRPIAVVGALLMVGGFAMFGSVVLGFLVEIWSTIGSARETGGSFTPPDINPMNNTFAGIPLLVFGFATFFVGIVLMAVGTGMSRAARKRYESRGRR